MSAAACSRASSKNPCSAIADEVHVLQLATFLPIVHASGAAPCTGHSRSQNSPRNKDRRCCNSAQSTLHLPAKQPASR